MGLREEKKRRQRREIVDTAIAMFRERGYDRTRVQDIAGCLQINEGTFFNYFPTKDEILHEFALDQVELMTALVKKELATSERTASERVREIMRTIAQVCSADREFMGVVLARSNLFRASGSLKEKELRGYELFADLLREGQSRGEIRRDIDAMQLAEVLIGIQSLTALNWLNRWWGERKEELELRMLRAVDVFFEGCRQVRVTRKPAAKDISKARRRGRRLRKG